MKCVNCGTTDSRVLERHHVSHNPEIIIILCCNCHHLVHHHPEDTKLSFVKEQVEISELIKIERKVRDVIAEKRLRIQKLTQIVGKLDEKIRVLQEKIRKLQNDKKHLRRYKDNVLSGLRSFYWDNYLRNCLEAEIERLNKGVKA